MPDADKETRYFSKDSLLEWRCKYCPQTYDLNGGTKIITTHLTTGSPNKPGHGLEPESARIERVKNSQVAIDTAIVQAAEHPKKRRKIGDGTGESLDPNVVEILWVNVLAACSLTFRLYGIPQFRSFLTYLNPDIDVWFTPSHSTIKI